jgi:hypothetical protein
MERTGQKAVNQAIQKENRFYPSVNHVFEFNLDTTAVAAVLEDL